MAFAPLETDIRSLSRRLGLSSDLARLERAWEAEVGGLKSFARIAALERACLVVETDSPAAMQEISLRRRELVRRINIHLSAPLIRGITVRIANHHGD